MKLPSHGLLLCISQFMACASTPQAPPAQQLVAPIHQEAPRSIAKPPIARQNFESSSTASSWFTNELRRLDAVPIVVGYHPDLGYVADADVTRLLALTQDGKSFWLRRNPKESRAALPNKPGWNTVHMYEPDLIEHPDADMSALIRLAGGIELFLAFAKPASVRPEPRMVSRIPLEVTERDITVEPNETLDSTACISATPGQYCLAVSKTKGHDQREARTIVTLYDAKWLPIGSTGRNPSHWPENERGFLSRFDIESVFSVRGLGAPVFVTTAFTVTCPCIEFRLHTFSPDGKFATMYIANGVVADSNNEGFCACSV